MAQTAELVDRKAKFVMGTKLAKGGQYNFTLQNLKDGATPADASLLIGSVSQSKLQAIPDT